MELVMTRNITLNADEKDIREARRRASSERKSLNVVFREWLHRYARRGRVNQKYDTIMNMLRYADAGKHFSRGELNERQISYTLLTRLRPSIPRYERASTSRL
jgi:hypothetical protein